MYDTIICKYPLPMPDDPKGYVGSHDFQTKDLDLALSLFDIDENGQLFIHQHEGEWTEGNKDSKSIFGRIGYFKTTKKWLEQLNTTNTIVFYDYQHSQNTDHDYFIEYEAIFINGKMTSVKLINFEANDNTERKKKDEEFDKKLKDWHEFTKTRKYRYIFRPYSSCVRFVSRKLSSGLKFLQSNLYKVEKFFLIK